jgi:hypothetical protein
VLAVLVAIGMVAGALYVRGRIDDDDGGGAGRGRGGGGDGPVTLVCAPELEAACAESGADEVDVEDAAVTAERLLTADATGFDAWLTPGPWPAMVDELRRADGRPALFEDDSRAVASTRLALVGPPDAPDGWRAVGDRVAGGQLRLGWRDPGSGLGVLQAAAFAVGWFQGPDFATNDFDPAFTAYLEGIALQAEVAPEPLERRLPFGPAFAAAVLELDAPAVALLEEAAPGRRGDLAPLYPEPVVVIEAVLVGGDDVADPVRDALEAQGWGEPAETTNLPRPGVLAALWQEVSR